MNTSYRLHGPFIPKGPEDTGTPTFPSMTTFPSGSRIKGRRTIYFLKEVFWEYALFSKTGWLSKKFLWEDRIRANLPSSFTGIFFNLLLTLHPCIAVTENIGLANKMLWKNPNFWPTQSISLKILNLGSEAFHWAHSATTFPSDHKEGQLRRPSWTSANICILASLLLQPFDPRRFLYKYCAVLSYSVVSESLRPHGL